MDTKLPPPRRRFGQNFLVDESATAWIVDQARAGMNPNLIEIGPGRGALTRRLSALTDRLVAVELDRDLVGVLRQKFPPPIRIVEADAARLDWPSSIDEWFGPNERAAAIGNLPYNVATPIVRSLFRSMARFTRLVLMFQSEVADRLEAEKGGDYGFLSVERWLAARVVGRRDVPPGAFHPRPKVSSAILVMEPREAPPTPAEAKRIGQIASAAFTHRRKLFLSNFGRAFDSEDAPAAKAEAARILQDAGLPLTARAEEIRPELLLQMARCISPLLAKR